MVVLHLFFFVLYGAFIGWIAKIIHPEQPGELPVGFLGAAMTGIAGTYIGGLINCMLGWGHLFSTSGILMSIVGGVIFLAAWRWWHLPTKSNFWTGQ